MGRLRPEVEPLTFLYTILAEKPEKGTPFGWSIPVWAIIGSTPPPHQVVDHICREKWNK